MVRSSRLRRAAVLGALAVLVFSVSSSSATQANAIRSAVDLGNGVHLSVVTGPAHPFFGRFAFAKEGAGVFWASGATITANPDGTTDVTYVGTGWHDPSAIVDVYLGLHSYSGSRSAVSLDLTARLESADGSGSGHLTVGGSTYEFATVVTPPAPDATVAQVLGLIRASDWNGVYGHLTPQVQGRVTGAEFQANMQSGLSAFGSITDARQAGSISESNQGAWFAADVPIQIDFNSGGQITTRTSQLALVYMGSQWRVFTIDQVGPPPVDTTPPVSTAGPLNPTYSNPTIQVPFTASDDRGVASVELWWRYRATPTGTWTAYALGPSGPTSPISFSFASGYGYYELYTIAVDGAGNREAAPSVADAATQYVRVSGTWAWGRNEQGQLGGTTTETCYIYTCSTQPIAVGGLPAITRVVGAELHSTSLASDGTIWTWGDNGYGQLGVGGGPDSMTPVQVGGISSVTAIDANGYHTLARRSNGTVWIWGYQAGGIGDGTTATTRSSPVQVTGLTNVVKVAAGQHFSLALKADGTVWAWGQNNEGQLGNNSTRDSAVPVQVLTGVSAIAAGGFHSIALKTDGTVWAWGDNFVGQLGIGNSSDKHKPTLVPGLANVTKVAAGWSHTFAIQQGGALWAWGWNADGEVGDGTTSNRLSPFRVTTVSNVVDVDGGYMHSVAQTTGGAIWGWGGGRDGQLDSGSTARQLVPVAIATSITPVTWISAGAYYTLAHFDP